jgi:uncharacterized iron-regulated membrane protein
MIIALAVLLAIVLVATTLLALMASVAAVYLWHKRKKAIITIENLTALAHSLNTEKQVLLAQQPSLFYSKQGTIH